MTCQCFALSFRNIFINTLFQQILLTEKYIHRLCQYHEIRRRKSMPSDIDTNIHWLMTVILRLHCHVYTIPRTDISLYTFNAYCFSLTKNDIEFTLDINTD